MVGDRVLSWPGCDSNSLCAWCEQQATTFSPPLFALSCFVAQDGLKLPILLPELLPASTPHCTWSLFPLLRGSWRRGSNQSPSQKNVEGSYSWQISSSGISGNSCKEHVWVGVEGLSQCEWRGTWVSSTDTRLKKNLVLQLWRGNH